MENTKAPDCSGRERGSLPFASFHCSSLDVLMRLSRFPIATTKETPADAQVISHQLMQRAGYIRKLGAGLYTWMPIGKRVLAKIENIVRA